MLKKITLFLLLCVCQPPNADHRLFWAVEKYTAAKTLQCQEVQQTFLCPTSITFTAHLNFAAFAKRSVCQLMGQLLTFYLVFMTQASFRTIFTSCLKTKWTWYFFSHSKLLCWISYINFNLANMPFCCWVTSTSWFHKSWYGIGDAFRNSPS